MSLRDDVQKITAILREEADRAWHRLRSQDSKAMAQLWRPNLGPTPAPLRRMLEPAVAASGLFSLIALLGMGLTSLVALSVAAALVYLILTYVFGIELDFQMPSRSQ
jgi:hypothetical protein